MDIYQRYAELSRTIREASDEQAQLKARIVGYLNRRGEPLKKSFGTFSVADFPTYKYSARVEKLEAQLRDIKKQERELGKATKTVSQSLRFIAK